MCCLVIATPSQLGHLEPHYATTQATLCSKRLCREVAVIPEGICGRRDLLAQRLRFETPCSHVSHTGDLQYIYMIERGKGWWNKTQAVGLWQWGRAYLKFCLFKTQLSSAKVLRLREMCDRSVLTRKPMMCFFCFLGFFLFFFLDFEVLDFSATPRYDSRLHNRQLGAPLDTHTRFFVCCLFMLKCRGSCQVQLGNKDKVRSHFFTYSFIY